MATIAENLTKLQAARTSIADAIVQKGGTVSQGDGFEDFPDDIASITNTYTASDEGKVVSNGVLVSQGSDTVTQNGTVDTTLISSLLVNVGEGEGTAVTHLTTENYDSADLYLIEAELQYYVTGRVYKTDNNSFDIIFPSDFDMAKLAVIGDYFSVMYYANSRYNYLAVTQTIMPDYNKIRISGGYQNQHNYFMLVYGKNE